MVDSNKAGTGEVLGTIDCGELGEIQVEDDGDSDAYVDVFWNGNFIGTVSGTKRADVGDSRFMEILDSLGADEETSKTTDLSKFDTGPFACDECHETWPSSKNEGTGDEDICPNCV